MLRNNRSFIFQARNYPIALGAKTCLMAIMNLTPDSFSQDGCLKHGHDVVQNVRLAKRFIKQGADILDIGGQSTRPGSKRISAQEEMKRVLPTIEALIKAKCSVPISIDTYQYDVAKAGLDAGVSIVNNIQGVRVAKKFLKMVASYQAGIILMHIQGTPQSMQKNIHYQDLLLDINKQLKESIELCLECGIKANQIVVDPGIGFGKTVEDNLNLIKHLDLFKRLHQPILIGTSRKSFIGKVLDLEIHQRLSGSLASICASILNGAHIVRVHDVKETKQTINMIDAICSARMD